MKKGFLEGYKTYDTTNGYGSAEQWRKSFNQRMNREDAEEILQQQTETPQAILGIAATPINPTLKKLSANLSLNGTQTKINTG